MVYRASFCWVLPMNHVTTVNHTAFLNSKITVPLPVDSVVCPDPSASRSRAPYSVRASFSVPASSGLASLQRVTMLAVPNPFKRSSMGASSLPPKKVSPLLKTPSRSHSSLTYRSRGKAVTGLDMVHGSGRLSYMSLDRRFGGSSYGARTSLSKPSIVSITFW
jgi:hypothetical protein